MWRAARKSDYGTDATGVVFCVKRRTIMENSNYLGTEKVGKLLQKFAIPCIFSLIISCLYNIVDQIFVGNGVGYLGNAATGVIFPITVVGWGLSLFFGDGAAAALSVSLGRGETKDIHRSVGSAALGSFFSGVMVIAIAYLWGDGLLRLIGATDANIQMAHEYGMIIFAMMPLAMTQNTLASIIRADGSPRYAMMAMLTGAVINIIGDPVAIFALDMGIRGAAWATIVGQFVSFLICAAYLRHPKTFRMSAGSFRPSMALLKPVMALGTSSLLTQLSIVIITVVNNILLVKYGAGSVYGADIPLAAFVVIMKLFQIVLNVAIGIAAGAQPIVGYNYGAKNYDRVRELLKLIVKWTSIVGLACIVLFEAVPGVFIRMFGSADDPVYFDFSVLCLRIYLSLILVTCVQKVCAIIGRSADYVLRNYPDVVRICIYAPESYREKKVMEMYGDSAEAAKKSIARSDAARGAYYKNVSGQEWGNPHGYELCIDSSVGEEETADMICSYIGRMGRQ